MSVTRLQATPAERANASVIETLRALLVDAEAGRIVAISGIAELHGSNYQPFGSSTMSRLQTAGALLELAVDRLKSE